MIRICYLFHKNHSVIKKYQSTKSNIVLNKKFENFPCFFIFFSPFLRKQLNLSIYFHFNFKYFFVNGLFHLLLGSCFFYNQFSDVIFIDFELLFEMFPLLLAFIGDIFHWDVNFFEVFWYFILYFREQKFIVFLNLI